MNKFLKFGFLGIIVVIIVGIIIGVLSGGEDASKPSKPSESSQPSKEIPKSETKSKETSIEKEKTNATSYIVKAGDMEYTINKKAVVDQVGGQSELPIKAMGKFLVLDVTLKNNGKKAVTITSSFFKLKHGDKTYKADSQVSILAQEDSSIFKTVKPGSKVSGKVIFDVPSEIASASDLQIQTGANGTKSGIINLK